MDRRGHGFSFFAGNPVIGMVLFLAIAFGFMFAINKTKDSAAGVAVLLAFTFFMGLMLSGCWARCFAWPMARASSRSRSAARPRCSRRWRRSHRRSSATWAAWANSSPSAAVLLIVGWIAFAFLQLPGMFIALALLGIVIFSAFMLYDLQRIMNGGETNYITATLALYLDVFNVFQNLLALLGIGSSD
jgi:FtsH-binding integral membrane protein